MITFLVALAFASQAWGDPKQEAEAFFRPFEVQEIVVSPDGSYLARWIHRDSWHRVSVHHRSGASRDRVVFMEVPIRSLAWADDDTLLVSYGRPSNEPFTHLIDLSVRREQVHPVDRSLGAEGQVVHPLPNEPGKILFSPARDAASVYKLDLSVPKPAAVDLDALPKVAALEESATLWVTDSEGDVRAALSVTEDDSPVVKLWYRESAAADWRVVKSSSPDDFDIRPLTFTRQGRMLVVSDRGRDTYALYKFNPKSDELTDLVYEHPTAQIVAVVFDYDYVDLLGVVYFEGGIRKYHYFSDAYRRYATTLEGRFSQPQHVEITGVSRDRRSLGLLVAGPRHPGEFFWFEAESGRMQPMGHAAPWLSEEDLAPVRTFRTDSGDGPQVEAFLTVPDGHELPPLVVMPHGGPIGVRHERGFDAEAQYLAAAGFAVLKVNYRGSSGYGKAHVEGGKRQWGSGIEDDVDAAIRYVLERRWVDDRRICIVGASYGGYSALMSAIRWPERFRCVGTVAGVTDIALMFNSSDFSLNDWSRKEFAEIVGDPNQDYEALRAASPVYRAHEIRVPVFIAHGEFDRRVDIEHALRLRAILDLYERSYEWMMLSNAGHGFIDLEQQVDFYEKLRAFLERHLGDLDSGGFRDHD